VAEADFTTLANSLGGSLRRAVTAGVATPSGGGTFSFGARSISNAVGAWGMYSNQANFAPTPANKGGSVRGAVKKAGLSGGQTLFSPLLFIGLQSADVNANGYLIGLSESEPHFIQLVKGKLLDGIPAVAPGTLGVLRRSTASYAADTWHHLRLDMVVNTNGDVVLNCFRSVLNVTTPSWAPIPGMAQIIDDALGANTQSDPFTNGYVGVGGRFAETSRIAYWDHVECIRQV
jgi:hypothetical protein